jgi:hypothetical protein
LDEKETEAGLMRAARNLVYMQETCKMEYFGATVWNKLAYRGRM